MKKKNLFSILFLLLFFIFLPKFTLAWAPGDPIVPQSCGQGTPPADMSSCPGDPSCPCGILDFFTMLGNIYSFIVLEIASPLAVIALIVGGFFMMVSAGNPNLFGTGKKIIFTAIIGLLLVFGSWLIIDFILCTSLSYCTWSTLF